MKVILSGGWGYKNIGDDLILSSTIKLLKNLDSAIEIIVLTYDNHDSISHLSQGVVLKPSLHKLIDCQAARYRWRDINENISIFDTYVGKLLRVIDNSKLNILRIIKYKSSKFENSLNGADLFIMCGGGYFNEGWASKTYSHIKELEIAQNLGIPTAVLGPSIGKLTSRQKNMVKNVFDKSKALIIRDEASLETLKNEGLSAKILSDIAITDWITVQAKNIDQISNIGITINSRCNDFIEILAEDISQYSLEHKLEISLVITRKWQTDFESAQNLMNILLKKNIRTKIVIPSDHVELDLVMSRFDLVISENLHGLISAARNLIPVIAINKNDTGSPNYKKIVAFLSQAGFDGQQIDNTFTVGELSILINKIEKNYANLSMNLYQLRQKNLAEYNFFISHYLFKKS